jgi:hypothetical protein
LESDRRGQPSRTGQDRPDTRSSRQRYNDQAYKEGTLPYPDGSIIAAIHWTRVSSEFNNKVLDGPFPGAQSFVVESRMNAQFMVKDSKKYAETGDWGFADFTGTKPGDKALHETCFPCHISAKDHDYVFTHYAP